MSIALVEGDLYRGERVVAFAGHRLQVAGDTAVGGSMINIAECTGDFLLDLGDPNLKVRTGRVAGDVGNMKFQKTRKNLRGTIIS